MQTFGRDAGEFRAAVAGFGGKGDRDGWEAFLPEAAAIFRQARRRPVRPLGHLRAPEGQSLPRALRRPRWRRPASARNLLDLLPITRDSVAVPLTGYGLKEIETLTGYRRQLEEFGGESSMARYIEATETADRSQRAAIMDELLAYNREDLQATGAVMGWLSTIR